MNAVKANRSLELLTGNFFIDEEIRRAFYLFLTDLLTKNNTCVLNTGNKDFMEWCSTFGIDLEDWKIVIKNGILTFKQAKSSSSLSQIFA